jgi:hypothetical protein
MVSEATRSPEGNWVISVEGVARRYDGKLMVDVAVAAAGAEERCRDLVEMARCSANLMVDLCIMGSMAMLLLTRCTID